MDLSDISITGCFSADFIGHTINWRAGTSINKYQRNSSKGKMPRYISEAMEVLPSTSVYAASGSSARYVSAETDGKLYALDVARESEPKKSSQVTGAPPNTPESVLSEADDSAIAFPAKRNGNVINNWVV